MPDGRATRGNLDALVANRMNAEPPILRGCSSSELLALAGLATVFWTPLTTLVGFSLGMFAASLGIGGMLIMVTVYFGAILFQWVKRGRPPGYYIHRPMIWLHRRGLWRSRFALPNGQLSLGRTWHP